MRCALVWVALMLVVSLAAGCSPGRAHPVSAVQVSAPSPFCEIQGGWVGTLRTSQGGFVFARTWGETRMRVEWVDGALRLQALVSSGGWRLHGRPDSQELYARSMLQLGEGVWVRGGGRLSILDARPGALAVGLSSDVNVVVRFVTPVGAWVPCAAIELSSSRPWVSPDDPAYREDWRVLGLPTEPLEEVLVDSRVALSSAPGGAPFAELAPRESALLLEVVEERAPYKRVVLYTDSAMVLGWIPASSTTRAPTGTRGSASSGCGDSVTLRICSSPERLSIAMTQDDGPAELIGTLEPGTPFELVSEAAGPDSPIVLRPHRTFSAVRVNGEGVRWIAHSSAPLTCADETW